MKTLLVLIGLLVVGALAAPGVTAHIVVSEEQPDGSCKQTEYGNRSLPPHFAIWSGDCEAYHPGWTLP